ncbi:MAG: hypothetical protein R3F08_04205 [Dokdonella sp.]
MTSPWPWRPEPFPAGVDTAEDLAGSSASWRVVVRHEDPVRLHGQHLPFANRGGVARVEFARVTSTSKWPRRVPRITTSAAAPTRAIAMAEAHGYPLVAHRARQLEAADFGRFDHLLAMDRVNLEAMRRAPAAGRERAALFLPFVRISILSNCPIRQYGQTRDFQRALGLARDGIMALTRRLSRS